MDLFEEIVNESELLTELQKSREKDVIYAINNMLHVRIGYSDEQGGSGKKERFIYPVAYGLTKRGNPAIRAFQTAGSTKRGVPKWKLFLFKRIFSWSNGKRSYKEYADNLKSLGFNESGDLGMTQIFAIAPIARGDIMVTSPSNSDISAPIEKTDIDQTSKAQKQTKNMPKSYKTAQQQYNNDVDNNKKDVYIDNGNDNLPMTAPKTEPFVKSDDSNKQSDNKTIDSLSANKTEPIKKNDLMPKQNNTDGEVKQNADDEINQQDEFQTKVNSLMDRMNNLYKNKEDDGNI